MKKIKNLGILLMTTWGGLTAIAVNAVLIHLVVERRDFYIKPAYTFNANNYKIINGLNSKSVPKYESQEFKNALQKDTEQKANSDSTIIYNVTFNAGQHRLAFASHIIKILDLNPNKEIIIMNRRGMVNLDFIDQKKYPNVQLKLQLEDSSLSNSQNLNDIDQVVDEILLLKSQNKKIDYYSDDYKFFGSITEIFDYTQNNKGNSPKMTIFNKYYFNKIVPLALLDSINLFSDGTASTSFYGNDFYSQYLLTNNKINPDGIYNSTLKTKEITDLYLESKHYDALKLFNTDYNPSLFLNGLINTNQKGNSNEKQKFFMITTQAIVEANSIDTTGLTLNNKEGDHFDPYNTLDSNLISLVKTFSTDMMSDLFLAFNQELINSADFEFMNNHLNYVYSPAYMPNQSVVDKEAHSVISLYNEAKLTNPTSNNIQIVLKGHPADANISGKIKNSIQKIDPSFNVGIISEINSKIPYELYLVFGVFDADPVNKKEVMLSQSFSTIGSMMYSENRGDDIFKFYVNDFGKNWLDKYHGPSSKIYPQSKIEYV